MFNIFVQILKRKLRKITVIGGGISGLTAASLLAKQGLAVTLLEKNNHFGGRLNTFEAEGFTFDMGPSWYWMPDIFEKFYHSFDCQTSDFYELVQLDPGFKVFFKNSDPILVSSDPAAIAETFESIEKGAGKQLERFLKEAQAKYDLSVNQFIYNPSLSWFEFVSAETIKGFFKYSLLTPFDVYVKKYFKDKRLRMIMEFPIIFLGAKSKNIPSLYSMMNHAAMNQGTFYPQGGMVKIAGAFEKIARKLGVDLKVGEAVESVEINAGKIEDIHTSKQVYKTDAVICAADYHHFEQEVLAKEYRKYSSAYWESRTLSPSSLLFFVGVNKKIEGLEHHNLFFDADFEVHTAEIYDTKQWPSDPLFYVCCPSKTDPSVAPIGQENLFFLMPIAAGIEDSELLRKTYFDLLVSRLEKHCGTQIKDAIVYHKSYCIKDFKQDYNSFKGNAYGLANSLAQTGVLKPSMLNNKLSNLAYAGQLTVPGPGLPPAIISGEIAAKLITDKILNHS